MSSQAKPYEMMPKNLQYIIHLGAAKEVEQKIAQVGVEGLVKELTGESKYLQQTYAQIDFTNLPLHHPYVLSLIEEAEASKRNSITKEILKNPRDKITAMNQNYTKSIYSVAETDEMVAFVEMIGGIKINNVVVGNKPDAENGDTTFISSEIVSGASDKKTSRNI
jgi:hypothetical protein